MNLPKHPIHPKSGVHPRNRSSVRRSVGRSVSQSVGRRSDGWSVGRTIGRSVLRQSVDVSEGGCKVGIRGRDSINHTPDQYAIGLNFSCCRAAAAAGTDVGRREDVERSNHLKPRRPRLRRQWRPRHSLRDGDRRDFFFRRRRYSDEGSREAEVGSN